MREIALVECMRAGVFDEAMGGLAALVSAISAVEATVANLNPQK